MSFKQLKRFHDSINIQVVIYFVLNIISLCDFVQDKVKNHKYPVLSIDCRCFVLFVCKLISVHYFLVVGFINQVLTIGDNMLFYCYRRLTELSINKNNNNNNIKTVIGFEWSSVIWMR